MESESGQTPTQRQARDALIQIRADRDALATAVTSTGAWYYPLFALFSALVVWAPTSGSPLQFTFIAGLSSVGLWTIEYLRDRTSGVRMSRAAGRRGLITLVVLGVAFAGIFGASLMFAGTGQPQLSIVCAMVTFVAMFLGAWLYDRDFRAEVSRGR